VESTSTHTTVEARISTSQVVPCLYCKENMLFGVYIDECILAEKEESMLKEENKGTGQ